MENKKLFNKKKLIVLIILLNILVFSYAFLIIINIKSLEKYDSVVMPNVYIEEFDMSGYSFKNALSKIEFYNEYILSKKVKFSINGKRLEYDLNQLGVSVDKEKTIQKIEDYQSKLSYARRLRTIHGKVKKKFNFSYKIDSDKLASFLNGIRGDVDVSVVNGYFDTSNGVRYISGVDGFSLDIDKSISIFKDNFKDDFDFSKEISLEGNIVSSQSNDSYKQIDTMTSSFVTKFNVWEGTRPINLRTALNYINGAIVEPGEVFSYFRYAGPYDKRGYVFYYEFVGNGVCQIATTTYNAALLGGLEIVKRYPHAKKSVYVAGGLDATVASYSSGWNVDFQFRNTYKYPIYIKAYAVGGEAHVEFWSNSNAKEGKEYTTESVKIGVRGYTTYLHTFKDGKEIDKSKIATTWYTEE